MHDRKSQRKDGESTPRERGSPPRNRRSGRREGESAPRVRLFAQGFAPNGAEGVPASIYDRLRRLEAEGVIDDCEVEVWGRKVPRRLGDDRPAIATDLLDRIDEFRAWADRTGASLDRCFHESTVRSELTDEVRTEVRLPVVCLAVYDGDDLTAVFPHAEAGEEYTVADGLEALASGDRRSNPRPETIRH